MALELYSARICPFASRVRLVASLLRLPVSVIEIDLTNKAPAFVALYPTACGAAKGGPAKVPVLRDGDFLLAESGVVATYLVDKFSQLVKGNCFMSEVSPKGKALSTLVCEQAGGAIISNFYGLLKSQDAAEQARMTSSLLGACEAFGAHLQAAGGNGPFFLGELPSLADCLVYPWVARFCVLKAYRGFAVPQGDERYRAFSRWADAMAAVPEVAATIEPDDFYTVGYESYAKPPAAV